MECADAKLRMEPYATGNLSSPDREAFEEHVANCEGCRLELELTRAMSGAGELEGTVGGAGGEIPYTLESGVEESGTENAPPGDSSFEVSLAEVSQPASSPPAGPTDPEVSFADIAPEIQDSSSPDLPLDTLLSSVQPPGAAPEDASAQVPASSAMPPAPAAIPPASPGEPRRPSWSAPRDRATMDDPLANLVGGPGGAPASPSQDSRGGGAPGAAPPGDAPPGGAPSAGAPSWDFEPADTKPQPPPLGSLFMAEEALQRGRGTAAERRRALMRTALWIAGGVAGVALLAFAGWIALNARPVPPRTARFEAAPPVTGSAAAQPGEPAPAPGAASTESPAAEPAPSTAESSPAQGTAPETAPAPVQQPPAAPVVEAGAASAQSPLPSAEGPAPASRGEASAAPSRKASSKRHVPTRVATIGSRATGARAAAPAPRAERATTAHTAPPAAPGSSRHEPFTPASPAQDSAAPPSRSQESPPAAPGAQSAPAAPPASGEEPRAPAAPPQTTPGGGGSPPAAAPSGGASSTTPAASAQPAPGATTQQSPGEAPAAGSAAPSADAVQRPIDRIHLATVAAEDRGDLSALRTLRDKWRTFIERTGVGADRIRAKRELADCLWAIQSLTARRSDQRDALRAYRDYILNAPAGGADARSISRTRQLEDALSETR